MGDTIELAGAQQYTVVAINLMVVTLLHSSGSRVYQPIAELSAQPLVNVSRSANKTESLRMTVDTCSARGSAHVVNHVSSCMAEHVKANPKDLMPSFQVTAEPNNDPLKFNLVLRYTFNGKGMPCLHGRAHAVLSRALAVRLFLRGALWRSLASMQGKKRLGGGGGGGPHHGRPCWHRRILWDPWGLCVCVWHNRFPPPPPPLPQGGCESTADPYSRACAPQATTRRGWSVCGAA